MADNKAKALEEKTKGNSAFAAKRYKEAIEHFTEAIGHDPTDHVFFSNRSACYASLEQYEKALEDGSECVKLKPDWPKGYTRKGLAEFFLQRYDDAAETYKAGLKLAPEDLTLKEGLKKAMDAKYGVSSSGSSKAGPLGPLLGEVDAAAMATARARNPKISEYMADKAFVEKLNVLRAMNSSGSGMQEQMMIQLIRQDPRLLEFIAAVQGFEVRRPDDFPGGTSPGEVNPTAQSRKRPREEPAEPPKQEDARTSSQKEADEFKAQGNQLYKKRKFDEAVELYDKAIEKEPNDLTYYNNKCAVWIEMGKENYEKVLKTCQDLIDRRYEINSANSGGASFEKVAKVYNRMASIYEKQKLYDKAIEMYNKALTEDNNRQTRNALREVERLKEKHEKEEYIDPAKAEEHRAKGNEHFKAKEYAEAKREYDEAIKRNPQDAKLYSNRAAAMTKLLAYPDALRDLDECLKLDPKFVKAYSRKGAAHFFMKEYHKALESYEKGLKLDQSNEECLKGREQVIEKIMHSQGSDQIDEEQVAHAMADPEIQKMLHDPQVRMFLKSLQENPAEAQKAMHSDPKLREVVTKLVAAGIIKTR
eukprot:TRINITY_DN109992_c0_g1_i1.p1 TRINITY_DN109992_c0_g1~~TRINITY_DN109992_c0_g1_i1.p1  ORF type:complete len:589 (+),score=160.00 TRINITY_DN109992_c0_g1_i1:63-1829(+)